MTVSDLLAKYESSDEPIEFQISGGEVFRARRLCDASEMIAIEKKAQEVQDLIKSGTAPPQWKEFLPASPTIIRMAVFCDELLIEPEITLLDGLRLAKRCGMLMLEVGAGVIGAVAGQTAVAETAAIEEAKNDLSATGSGEPG